MRMHITLITLFIIAVTGSLPEWQAEACCYESEPPPMASPIGGGDSQTGDAERTADGSLKSPATTDTATQIFISEGGEEPMAVFSFAQSSEYRHLQTLAGQGRWLAALRELDTVTPGKAKPSEKDAERNIYYEQLGLNRRQRGFLPPNRQAELSAAHEEMMQSSQQIRQNPAAFSQGLSSIGAASAALNSEEQAILRAQLGIGRPVFEAK